MRDGPVGCPTIRLRRAYIGTKLVLWALSGYDWVTRAGISSNRLLRSYLDPKTAGRSPI